MGKESAARRQLPILDSMRITTKANVTHESKAALQQDYDRRVDEAGVPRLSLFDWALQRSV